MASIQVSFDEIKSYMNNPYTQFPFGKDRAFLMTENGMVTFEQVTQIEAKRRQIEELQGILNLHATLTKFGFNNTHGHWTALPESASEVIREALCKHTVVQIIRLLDESERLGVDVTTSKQTLLTFLEGLKTQEPVVADQVVS
jgi:hypothetical protein